MRCIHKFTKNEPGRDKPRSEQGFQTSRRKMVDVPRLGKTWDQRSFISSVGYETCSQRIVTTGWDGSVQFVDRFQQVTRVDKAIAGGVVCIDPASGKSLVGKSDGTLEFEGKKLVSQRHASLVTSVCLNSLYLISSSLDGRLLVSLRASGLVTRDFSLGTHITCLALDGNILAIGHVNGLFVMDMSSWVMRKSESFQCMYIRSLDFRGGWLLVGTSDGMCILQHCKHMTPTLTHKFEYPVCAVAIANEQASTFASASHTGIFVWSMRRSGDEEDSTHMFVRLAQLHHMDISHLRFTPSGNFLVSGSDDCSLGLWDLLHTDRERLLTLCQRQGTRLSSDILRVIWAFMNGS